MRRSDMIPGVTLEQWSTLDRMVQMWDTGDRSWCYWVEPSGMAVFQWENDTVSIRYLICRDGRSCHALRGKGGRGPALT